MRRADSFSEDATKNRKFRTQDLVELTTGSTSKGNQRKWYYKDERLYIKEQFKYQGVAWKDYLVEIIASTFAEQMNLYNVRVLKQEVCSIDDAGSHSYGVVSKDFIVGDQRYVSMNTLLKADNINFATIDGVRQRWDCVFECGKSIVGNEYLDYLLVMSLLDYLVGNEDRHLANFGCLETKSGMMLAPLFDFGLGLFEHDLCYTGLSFRECLDAMQSKPFDTNNQIVIDFLQDRYDLRRFLPTEFDLTGTEIPSAKAGSYLRNRCMKLGIGLKGVE